MTSHYLYLSYRNSIQTYSSNKPWDYTIELQEPLSVADNSLVSLTDAIFPSGKLEDTIVIRSDICSFNYINGEKVNFLRILAPDEQAITSLSEPNQIQISRNCISSIRIRITNLKGDNYMKIDKKLICLLKISPPNMN